MPDGYPPDQIQTAELSPAEDRIAAAQRVGVLDDIAHPHIVQKHVGALAAIENPRLEFGLSLQYSHCRLRQFGNDRAVADDIDRMQGQRLVRRVETEFQRCGLFQPVLANHARSEVAENLLARRTCIVILEVADQDFRSDIGIMVDAVSEVLEIPASEIEPPPSFGAKIRADFIFGMGKVAGKFVIILNINNVLSVEEISRITDMASPTEAETNAIR